MLVSRICAGLFVGLLGCFALAALWDWFLASGILDYWPVIGLGSCFGAETDTPVLRIPSTGF